jgi:DNA-directed RNA polymerase specialized sigma24 family protein
VAPYACLRLANRAPLISSASTRPDGPPRRPLVAVESRLAAAVTKDWTLTKTAFDCLLAALDEDRERAGEQYEWLRRKLVRFFEWRGAPNAEDLSDRTLNVAARRLAEGEAIRDMSNYCLGVARNLLLDQAREQRREQAGSVDPVFLHPAADDPEQPDLCQCLEHCLAELPAESRRLLLVYYGGDKRAKIDARKTLAAERGISMNALRILAYRLRARLERDVAERMEAKGKPVK